ncbi:MAG: twitching motility protein PilT [Lachnospiraceae bacterium]|nr:twitching motility protein PilT [Lachnospiraceae bacterium]
MVQLIVGKKGKGKTKLLLDKVNTAVKEIPGNIVYLDKSTKHMYELNNKVRLVDVSEYLVNSADAFLGFVTGIISQDHDLQQMYFDSFLKIACLEGADVTATVNKLEEISERFNVDFVLSVSLDEVELPEAVRSKIIVSL